MFILLQSASLYDGQEVFVWSDFLLDFGTDFLVGEHGLCMRCVVFGFSFSCTKFWLARGKIASARAAVNLYILK